MFIDHIGIVVKSLQKGIRHWEDAFGYQKLTEEVINTRQKVKVVFLEKKDSLQVKLIEPLDDTSPTFALARRGGGLHHICFRCDELETEINRLKGMRFRVLAFPEEGEAFENEKNRFSFQQSGNKY